MSTYFIPPPLGEVTNGQHEGWGGSDPRSGTGYHYQVQGRYGKAWNRISSQID